MILPHFLNRKWHSLLITWNRLFLQYTWIKYKITIVFALTGNKTQTKKKHIVHVLSILQLIKSNLYERQRAWNLLYVNASSSRNAIVINVPLVICSIGGCVTAWHFYCIKMSSVMIAQPQYWFQLHSSAHNFRKEISCMAAGSNDTPQRIARHWISCVNTEQWIQPVFLVSMQQTYETSLHRNERNKSRVFRLCSLTAYRAMR